MAAMAATRSSADHVATLVGCSDRLLESIASPLLEFQRPRRRAFEELARGRLGEPAFAAAVERGRSMTIDEAVAYVLEEKNPTKQPEARVAPIVGSAIVLTRREREIATLVARGLSNKQIAVNLVISERTAESHILNILNTRGFNSRTQIASWSAEHRSLASLQR
jgi:DNA-binding NarL/FixJ family response regulator